MKNNICFTESFIQEEDAEYYYNQCMSQIHFEDYDLSESTILPMNGRFIVRILAKPVQGDLFE